MRALRRRFSVARRPLAAAVAALGLVAVAALPAAGATVRTRAKPADVLPTTTTCAASGTNGIGTTCTGTHGGDHAFDWATYDGFDDTQSWYPDAPTVTVSQTKNLTNQVVHVSWTNFTPSFNGLGVPGFQAGSTSYAVGIFECTADPQKSPLSQASPPASDCYGPLSQVNAVAGPANAVRTVTSADGTGQADVEIETAVQNSLLGCSDKKPCSLAIVPNWGGQQNTSDVGGTDPSVDCLNHTVDSQWDITQSSLEDFDNLIGYPCSWADRIVVPLSFAPIPTSVCPPSSYQFNSEGSPMLEHAMTKWLPAWCLSKASPLSVGYDSGVDEQRARQDFLQTGVALTASTDMALVTLPAASGLTSATSIKFTYAPLVVSGISISYYIDDAQTGKPITNLKLDARLVAKLLTQSYALQYGFLTPITSKDPKTGQTTVVDPKCSGTPPVAGLTCDPAVAGNPLTIFDDPELYQLNPEYVRKDFPSDTSAADTPLLGTFLPTIVQGNSDLVYELTRWIKSDPEASAFLAGQVVSGTDPNSPTYPIGPAVSMHVNDNYRNTVLPVEQMVPLDGGYNISTSQAIANSKTPHGTSQNETMLASWNPIGGYDNVPQQLIQGMSTAVNPQLTCLPTNTNSCTGVAGWQNPKLAPQNIGSRGLFAITDQGTAGAFRFPEAQLVNADGVAVAPTTASMGAAVSHMLTNPDGTTQYADFTNKDPNAYPLTVVDYAMVPTCGLSAAKASAISKFLGNVASSTAQSYGPTLGQLNDDNGYLALDSAQVKQTKLAATQVSTQSCTSPPPDTTVSGTTPPKDLGGVGNTSGLGGTGLGGTGATTGGTKPAGTTKPSGHATGSPKGGTEPVALGTKSADGGATPVMTAVLVLGALLLVGGPAAYAFGTTEQGVAFYRRLRQTSGRISGRLTRMVRR